MPNNPKTSFVVTKLEDDPLAALRAHIGGHSQLGWYVKYRGDRQAIISMLMGAIDALKADVKQNPPRLQTS